MCFSRTGDLSWSDAGDDKACDYVVVRFSVNQQRLIFRTDHGHLIVDRFVLDCKGNHLGILCQAFEESVDRAVS